MSIADKLTAIAENVEKVYEAGKAAGGGTVIGLPTYETDVTYVSNAAAVSLVHNLNTQKFLLIGRVKEHDGTDLNAWRISQMIVWSPYAYFQNAQYNFANGGTYNPYEYWVDGDIATTGYIATVSAGSATATIPVASVVNRNKSGLMHTVTDNSFTLALNTYLLTGATWHFTVVDVSSIM